MNDVAQEIIRVLKLENGKDISSYDSSFLAKSAERRMKELRLSSLKAYLEYFKAYAEEAKIFYRSLNITYSEFFRNPLSFDVLEYVVLPSLFKHLRGNRKIRVWCAGCSGGQEAYSAGIVLEELSDVFGREVPFTIFGTDIAEEELENAARGFYDTTMLRNVRLGHLSRYFSREGDHYSVKPELKAHTHFSMHDLLDTTEKAPAESIYGDFDLIFCSNLLFYYTASARDIIVKKVFDALSPDGFLVTGETERMFIAGNGGFTEIMAPSAIFKKQSGSDRV
jgi:chemotaxis methyl-accepting protein methylase